MEICENCSEQAVGYSLDEVPLCEKCGNGLEATAIKTECPECLTQTTQDELDMFGGFCEVCYEDLDGGMFEEETDPDYE